MKSLCIALLSFFALMPDEASAADDLKWGINGHPFVSYPGVSFEEQLDLVQDLGLTSYRVDVTSLDHASPLEHLIDLAAKRGITILPVLIPPAKLENEEPASLREKASTFATHFVTRFKDRVRVWELGNELENFAIIKACEMRDNGEQYNCSWGPASGLGPLDYYGPRWKKVSAVLKGLSDATGAADPTALRAIGTAGWGHVGAFERMRQDGIAWEISVWHNYDSAQLEWGLKQVAAFGKPIWLTEFNVPHGSQKGAVRQSTGIAHMIGELRRLHRAYNVEAAHIYELLDETYWRPSLEAYKGLVELSKVDRKGWRTDGPKPGYCSVRVLLRGGYRLEVGAAAAGARKDRQSSRPSAPVPGRRCNLCAFDTVDAKLEDAISYAYCLVLGRAADGAGLAAWSRDIGAGHTTLSKALHSQIGMQIRKVSEAEGLDDAGFVAYLRRLLLDEEPEGIEHWALVRELERGALSRDELITEIVTSARFRWMHPQLGFWLRREKAS